MRGLHTKPKCHCPPACAAAMGLLVVLVPAAVQGVTVSGRVIVTGRSKKSNHSAVVVWLTPISGDPVPARALDAPPEPFRLVQKNKEFYPHLLVVPAGAIVEFPNLDPFFHNVFSLFDGKRFDLGLYEAGSTRWVRFDRPGISYIFCNIHPDMSAVIVAMATPYYGVSNLAGEINIHDVPLGRYKLEFWQESALPEDLKKLSREITVAPDANFLGTFYISDSGRGMLAHKNKYGRDYDEPASPNPLYNYPQ
jgi:plastocyanin